MDASKIKNIFKTIIESPTDKERAENAINVQVGVDNVKKVKKQKDAQMEQIRKEGGF
jgi:hypothetical protein